MTATFTFRANDLTMDSKVADVYFNKLETTNKQYQVCKQIYQLRGRLKASNFTVYVLTTNT